MLAPALMIGVGLLLGVVFVLAMRSQSPAKQVLPGQDSLGDPTADDHERTASLALEGLHELSAERHQLDEQTFASEKLRLEQVAARALRERTKRPKHEAAAPVPAASNLVMATRRAQLIGAAWGGGLVLFVASLFFLLEHDGVPGLKQAADERYEAMLTLSAISLSIGDSEHLLEAWEIYMRQQPPRRRPPQLERAYEWLEQATEQK